MNTKIVAKLDDFFSKYPPQKFKKGNIIIQAGADPTRVIYVKSGIIKEYWISENGEEIILNLYKPNSFLPMSWAIGGIENTHFYEAMTDVVAYLSPKEDLLTLLKKEPDIVIDLLRRMYIGMEGLWVHLESLTSGNSSIKLIASLVILAKRFGKKEGEEIRVDLKLSEQDIANYAGMSRETASRELQKLKKEELVSFKKGMITVSNIDRLESFLHP